MWPSGRGRVTGTTLNKKTKKKPVAYAAIKELLPPLEEDFINNRIEATFGEFFGT